MTKGEAYERGLRECPRCVGTGYLLDPVATGGLMRAGREQAAVTLRTLAKRMGISAAYLCDLELGRRGWNEGLLEEYMKALKGEIK